MTTVEDAFARRDWEGVVAATDAGALARPASVAARAMRGWALYHLGRYDEGLAAFDDILAIDPTSTDAAVGRGRCHRMMGRIDESAAAFALAHELSPEDPHPLCERGAVLILDERWDEALADYEAAQALNPAHPGLASYFAELHLYAGRPQEALRAAQSGVEREPNSVLNRVNLAHALLFLGEQDRARGEYLAVCDRIAASEHKSGAAVVLNDFSLMREAGLTCEGFDEMEALMRERA